MKCRTFRYLQPLLISSLLFVGPGFAYAADFKVVTAKGVEDPTGLKWGDSLNRGQKVKVGTAGLLILRQVSGCSNDLVIVGPEVHTLQLLTGNGCRSLMEASTLREKLKTGEPLLARVAFTGDGKADTMYGSLVSDPCLLLPEVSEEDDRSSKRCPSGYLLHGMKCSGSYCDNLRLRCCPYLEGRADPTMNNYHSQPITGETNAYATRDFVNGVTCKGRYCGEVFPHAVESSRFENTGQCSWTQQFSEETPRTTSCPSGSFVSGVRCTGRYCDNLSLQCCALKETPNPNNSRNRRPAARPAN